VSALIGELSCRFGTPTFPPHVTLLAGLDQGADAVVARARQLARALHDLSVRFAGLEESGHYLRALSARIEPELPILDARRRAEAVLEVRPSEPFLPHLSLLYGDVPAPTRRLLANEVAMSAPPSIVLRALEVVSTEGTVGEWRRLERWPLGL
jgi:hypothetical protein